MDFVRYRDGLVAEHWNVVDLAGLQAQLTAPDPAARAGDERDPRRWLQGGGIYSGAAS